LTAHNKVELFNPQQSAPAFRVSGSLSQFIDVLHQKLDQTKVLLSQEVSKIEENSTGLIVTSKQENFHSDYVVTTLAPRLASSIFWRDRGLSGFMFLVLLARCVYT
jgi:monoamine oxidase